MTRPNCGTLREVHNFRVRGCHPLWPAVPSSSANNELCDSHVKGPTTPRGKTRAGWAISSSLAATEEIDFSFFSCGYLDVSVHRVVHAHLWIQCASVRESWDQHSFVSSPRLFADFHALQSLLMPRHPPCALSKLDHDDPTLSTRRLSEDNRPASRTRSSLLPRPALANVTIRTEVPLVPFSPPTAS